MLPVSNIVQNVFINVSSTVTYRFLIVKHASPCLILLTTLLLLCVILFVPYFCMFHYTNKKTSKLAYNKMRPKQVCWLHEASRGVTLIAPLFANGKVVDNNDELYRRWISHSKLKRVECGGGGDEQEHCCITVLGGCIWFRFYARADSKALESLPDPSSSSSSTSSFRQVLHWAIQGMATEYMMLACVDALIVISKAMIINEKQKAVVPIIPERIVTILMEEVIKAYLEENHHHESSTSAEVVCSLARQIQGHFTLLNILQPHQQQHGTFLVFTACFQEERQNEQPNNSSSLCQTDWRYPFLQRLLEHWANSMIVTIASSPANDKDDDSYDPLLPFLCRFLPGLCVGFQAYAIAAELLQDPVFAQCRLLLLEPTIQEPRRHLLAAVKSWIMDCHWLVEESMTPLGLGGTSRPISSRVFLQSSITCMAQCLLEEYETRRLSASSSLQSAKEPGSLMEDDEDMGRALAHVGMQVESYCHCDGRMSVENHNSADAASSRAHLAMMLLERAEVSLALGLFSRMSRVAMALRYVGMVLHIRRNDEMKQQARKAFHVYHCMKQDFVPSQRQQQQQWPATASSSQLLSIKRNLNEIVDILFVVQDALSALVIPDKGLDLCTSRLKEELRSVYQLIGLLTEVLLTKSSPQDLDVARDLLNTQDVISGVVSSNDSLALGGWEMTISIRGLYISP